MFFLLRIVRHQTIHEMSVIAQLHRTAPQYDDVRSLRCNMPSTDWEEIYLKTVLEVHGSKMPERIAATRNAIAGRLQDLKHDSDHHVERGKMERALQALDSLEVEARNW